MRAHSYFLLQVELNPNPNWVLQSHVCLILACLWSCQLPLSASRTAGNFSFTKYSFPVFLKQLNLLLPVTLHMLFPQLEMNFPQITFRLIPVCHLGFRWKTGEEKRDNNKEEEEKGRMEKVSWKDKVRSYEKQRTSSDITRWIDAFVS